MWEYRLIWTAAAPPWWEDAWTAAQAALQRQGRQPETRADTYLVLPDRPDVGLKLRGENGELEVKVRHDARNGWELWEKTLFRDWNALEAARFSTLLQRDLSLGRIDAAAVPGDGVRALLAGADQSWRKVEIGKKRMQARAGDLVADLSTGIDPAWLAEIVEIRGAVRIARSICFETMAPEARIGALPGAADARNIGYPEFLIGGGR